MNKHKTPFAATWMDLEIVILNQMEKEKISYDIIICGF